MKTLAENIVADADAKQRDAWARYRQLLRANSVDPAAVEELRGVMATLSKSPADVQADANVIRAADSIAGRLKAACGVGKGERAAKASIPAYVEETDRIARERAAGLQELERQYAQRVQESAAASGEVEQLNKLLGEHPQLLADVKPATCADVD